MEETEASSVPRAGAGTGGQDYSVMVAGVVKHENDTATVRSMPQQLGEEALKRYRIEQLADGADELTGA